MTVSEMVAELIERADELDGKPMDATEALARKIAELADKKGVLPVAIEASSEDLTDEERAILTPAVIERAERRMQEATEKTKAKAQKLNDSRAFPILPKKADGWYFDASIATPDVPEYGPYATRKECEEARVSFMRSQKGAAKNEAKEKARKAGTGAKPGQPKSEKLSDSQRAVVEKAEGGGKDGYTFKAGSLNVVSAAKAAQRKGLVSLSNNPGGTVTARIAVPASRQQQTNESEDGMKTKKNQPKKSTTKSKPANGKPRESKRPKALGKYNAGPFARFLGRKGIAFDDAKRIMEREGVGHLSEASLKWELKETRETHPAAPVTRDELAALKDKYPKAFETAKAK